MFSQYFYRKSSQHADVGIIAKLKDDPLVLELSPCSDASPGESACIQCLTEDFRNILIMCSTMMPEKRCNTLTSISKNES